MTRSVENRYRGLPQRTPEMLFHIIQKFYRGAASHIELIEKRKQDAVAARVHYLETGEATPLSHALFILFSEMHFYVTCWLQVELALYRLSRMEHTREAGAILAANREELERHLHVRQCLEDIRSSVEEQFAHFGERMECVVADRYWFHGVYFTVDAHSFHQLSCICEEAMKMSQGDS